MVKYAFSMLCCGKDFSKPSCEAYVQHSLTNENKVSVARVIRYFELGNISFNLYVYYLTRGFIASTRAFNLPTSAFNLVTRAFNLATRAFNLLTRGFELVTRGLLFHVYSFKHKYFAVPNLATTPIKSTCIKRCCDCSKQRT